MLSKNGISKAHKWEVMKTMATTPSEEIAPEDDFKDYVICDERLYLFN